MPDESSHEIRHEALLVSRTARYSVLGAPDQCTALWTCIHGYGQLADSFLTDMSSIATGRRALVAPEALSRFYLSGSRGTVGASWMTTRERHSEINDYVGYLDALRDTICSGRSTDAAPGHIAFGFSQGAATLTRWLARTVKQTDAVVLWGGRVAHDIDEAGFERLRAIKHRYLVFGDNDRYADEARINHEVERLNERSLPFRLVRFEGGHAILPDVLSTLAEQVESDLNL